MLKIERYGLLALFALCALILGVGVFGGDGSEAAWKPEMPPNSKAAGQLQERSSQGSNRARTADENLMASGQAGRLDDVGRLQRVPSPTRDASFPGEDADLWAEPKVLERTLETGDQPIARKAVRARPVAMIVVRKNDTFWDIAGRELGDHRLVPQLMAANPDVQPKALQEGQKLVRPVLGKATQRRTNEKTLARVRHHVVQPGDTLGEISKRYYGSARLIEDIARANRMGVGDVLLPDRKIRIPPDPRRKKKTDE